MSIRWIDLESSNNLRNDDRDDLDDEEEEEEEESEGEEAEVDDDDSSDYAPVEKVKVEPDTELNMKRQSGAGGGGPSAKRAKVTCVDCGKGFHPAYLPRHQASSCRGRKPEPLVNCKFCDKLLPNCDLEGHYATCVLATCDPSARAYAVSRRARSSFQSRKVIDIMESEDGSGYHAKVAAKDELEEELGGVMCPECAKVFADQQGRDEHLVYTHHYHFRIRFNDRAAFQRWFKGMRFDQIMYKANMSTVNGTTYEYYFCLHTAVNRRVRIRDRCPCRAFVKETTAGITVSYLDVHSHPQLKYKRYMTDECRALILSMLEEGKRNFDILMAVRERYSEASINYTIARTTINSIRFKYKKKMWAQRCGDIKKLQERVDREAAKEKRQQQQQEQQQQEQQQKEQQQQEQQHQWWMPDLKTEQATQTGGLTSGQTGPSELAPPDPANQATTREEKDAVLNDILRRVLPGLEAALRRGGLGANQLHNARVHLSKVTRDLNPDKRWPAADHDYTYLGPR